MTLPPVARAPGAAQAAAPARAAIAANTVAGGGAGSPVAADAGVDVREMRARLEEAIGRLNEIARQSGRNLSFSFDDIVDRTVVTVRNAQTGEVVRQIPNEVVLKLAHHAESVKGMFYDGSI